MRLISHLHCSNSEQFNAISLVLKVITLGFAIKTIVLSTAFVHASSDSSPLLIDKDKANAALALSYFRDNEGGLLIEDVLLQSANHDVWIQNQDPVPNFGFGPVTMWFFLPIKNPTNEPIERFLEIQNPVLDEVILYQVSEQDKLVSRQVTGDRYAMSKRPVEHYNLIFKLTVPPGEQHNLYLKVMTDGAMQLPLYSWAPGKFYKEDQLRLLGYGIFFGVLLVMACYNLFVHFMMQERVFLYYAGYALSLAMFELSMNGFANQYLWPDSPWWREHSVSMFLPILIGFGVLFSRSFLQLKVSHRRLYGVFGVFLHLALLSAVLSLFVSYAIIIKVCTILAVPVCLLSVSIAIYRWREGYIAARFFVMAYALFFVSVLAYAASKSGIIAQTLVTEHAMPLGAMLGSLISAFALTDRMNSQRLSYMQAQENALIMQKAAKQDLEKTVAERTEALQDTLNKLEAANAQLQSLSLLDGLTGIKNRRFFDEKIAREWSRAIRHNGSISLLAIDIDHFKRFNDNYGHLLGDQCLRHVAEVIESAVLRPADAVTRYGGEEFMVILPGTKLEGAMYLAEEVRSAIEKKSFEHDGEAYHLTVSIGVSALTPIKGEGFEKLVSEADRALYQSKKRGRNCVTAF